MDEVICRERMEKLKDDIDDHEGRIADIEKWRESTGLAMIGLSKDMEFTKENTKDIKTTLQNVQSTVTNETVKKKADSWEKAIWLVLGAIIMFALKKMGI